MDHCRNIIFSILPGIYLIILAYRQIWNLKKIILFLTVFFVHQYLLLFGQLKEPGRPYIPEINNINDFSAYPFRARITVQGRDGLIEGEMVLNSDVLNTPDNKNIKIKDLSRINILLWEKRRNVNKYLFYPARYELIYYDNRKVTVNGNIDLLNKIKIGSKKSYYLYSYYYDYLKNGRWINSGVSDYDSSVLKPAAGCIVVIELIQ